MDFIAKVGIGQHLAALLEDSRVSAFLATFSVVAGLGTCLDYLPKVLGGVTSLSALLLTWMAICRIRLQIKVLKKELEEK